MLCEGTRPGGSAHGSAGAEELQPNSWRNAMLIRLLGGMAVTVATAGIVLAQSSTPPATLPKTNPVGPTLVAATQAKEPGAPAKAAAAPAAAPATPASNLLTQNGCCPQPACNPCGCCCVPCGPPGKYWI